MRNPLQLFVSRHREEQFVVVAAVQSQVECDRCSCSSPLCTSHCGNLRLLDRAPTPLAAHSRGKSVERPSERSIIAEAKRFSASHRPKAKRGSG